MSFLTKAIAVVTGQKPKAVAAEKDTATHAVRQKRVELARARRRAESAIDEFVGDVTDEPRLVNGSGHR